MFIASSIPLAAALEIPFIQLAYNKLGNNDCQLRKPLGITGPQEK